MKKLHLYNTVFLLFGIVAIANAQFDDVVKYWTFDVTSPSKDQFSLFNTSESIDFAKGVEGQGVSFVDKNYWVSFGNVPDLEEDFSMIFWFNPATVEGTQSLLLQSKTKANGEFRRYLHLALSNGKLVLKNEKEGLPMYQTPEIQANFWYQITYVYRGHEFKLYLDQKLIYESKETTMFRKLPCCEDRLHIGKPANSAARFKGYIDEIIIYEEGIDQSVVAEINKIINMPTPKVVIDTPQVDIPKPEIPVETPKITRNELTKITDKRLNELQHSIAVTTTNIEFEIWDYDEFDNDKVRFVWNDASFYTNILLNKKWKANKYDIPETMEFKENDDNFLIFVAEDMGDFPSQNTAAVRLWLDGKKQDKIYKFVLTEDKNAVLKIIHSDTIKSEKPIVEVPVEKDTTKLIASTKSNEPEPEIIVNKIAKNKHELTVSDTVLMIRIMDNSIVDGDSVRILHDGKVILDNHGLTKNLHSIEVKLTQNQANNFTFIPLSMGSRNTQNTALVIIEAAGKVIDKVTLGSLGKNKPAKLVIVHKSKE